MIPAIGDNPSRLDGRVTVLDVRCSACPAREGVPCSKRGGGFHASRVDRAISKHRRIRRQFQCPGCGSKFYYESRDEFLFCSDCDGHGNLIITGADLGAWWKLLRSTDVAAQENREGVAR